MAELNPLFYTSGPLVRLSKEFTVNGHSMASVVPRIHSFLLPAGFTTPKSSGAPVKEALADHQTRMIELQALRGYTDAEMKRKFCGSKDALWLNVGANFGFFFHLELCFRVVDPRLSVSVADGVYEPIELVIHHKLGHSYMRLTDSGDFISAADRNGKDIPVWGYLMGPNDRARPFNNDVGTGFVRR